MTMVPDATPPVRVVMLEDMASDADLIEYELRKAAFPFVMRRVDTRAAFTDALESFDPDVILSDFTLPAFSGIEALEISRERAPRAIFIVVTGSLDEESAVGCMRAGATDYVLKDRLARLGPAILAGLEMQRVRDAKAAAEEALRRSEELLRHSQKMEAVGRLAGGIAHDFNNLMTAIFGYCDLLLVTLDDLDARKRDVEEIRFATERAARLTRQLLTFSRKQVLEPQVLRLDDVVSHLGNMLRRLLGEDVELIVRATHEPAWVFADRGQLEQVITNLAVNARDAMPTGGRLSIVTSVVDRNDRLAVAYADEAPERFVLVEVSDSGAGMTEETKEHLFEPFFTTKAPGRGSGLGLATVYGIVSQSGGHIEVDSALGLGTTFRVYLPYRQSPVRDDARDTAADHPERADQLESGH
jgi:two-component system, cell cycle sensor histidine kinase and response regulator CckA